MNKLRDQSMPNFAERIEPEMIDELIEAIIVRVVSNPHLGERFSAAIEQAKNGAENGAVHPRAQKARGASSFSYDDVETPQASIAGPEANEMLDTIRERLTTSPMLRRRPALTEIAYDFDVPLAKRDTMPRMAQKILLSLAERDSEDIEMALNRVNEEAKRGSTEAFMEFASFIMGDRRSD